MTIKTMKNSALSARGMDGMLGTYERHRFRGSRQHVGHQQRKHRL